MTRVVVLAFFLLSQKWRNDVPKFYVQSGNLKRIVMAPNQVEAAVAAIRQSMDQDEIGTSEIFMVSEKGFLLDRPIDDQFEIDSSEIINLTEVLEAMDDTL